MSNQQPGSNGQQSTAIVKGALGRMEAVKAELKRATPSLASMLPKHVTMDRMIRIVTSAVSRTPELLACTPQSIVLATAQACAIGLEPNTSLGLGYLIPFKGKAQFIPGYKGLIRLASNSGEVQSISSRIVRQHDHFRLHYGTEEKIVHEPLLTGDAGLPIGAYAVAEMKNGSKVFEFMSIAELEAIRNRSKASTEGPWVSDTTEMYRKTTIRRLCKFLPLSEEKLERALDYQAAAESGDGPDFSDVVDVLPDNFDPVTGEVTPANGAAPTRTDALKDRLAEKAASS